MSIRYIKSLNVLALTTVWCLMAIRTEAALVLTAAGTSEGFTLSTFASGFSNNGAVGPISTTYVGGGVLASSYNDGSVYHFATDADNQVIGGVGVTQNSGFGSGGPTGMASVGGVAYMVLQSGPNSGKLAQLNNDGSLNHYVPVSPISIPAATGLTADPVTGMLYVSTLGNNRIVQVNPLTGASSVVLNRSMDGIATDGTVLYGAEGGSINGYFLSTGSLAFTSGPISSSDGAALGQGSLLGKLYVNTNDGRVVEVVLSSGLQTVIATGGSRGDLVSVDPNGAGSLILSQTDSLVRLSAPTGGGFSSAVPEPTTWLSAVIGVVVVGVARRRGFPRA